MNRSVRGIVQKHADGAFVSGAHLDCVMQGDPEQPMVQVTTEAKGTFLVTITTSADPEWWRTLRFRVCMGSQELPVVSVSWSDDHQFATITVGEPLPALTLNGGVRHSDGSAVAGLLVRAFHRPLGGEVVLGQTTTDAAGQFEMSYTRNGASGINLFVRAFDSDNKILATSDVRVGAGEHESFTLTISDKRFRGISEFQRATETLTPLVADVNVTKLSADDVALLVRQTGLSRVSVTVWIASLRLSKRYIVSHEALYALVRVENTALVPRLLSRSHRRLRAALASASSANLVSLSVSEQADQTLRDLRSAAVEFHASIDTPGSLGRILTISEKATPEQQKEFIRRRLDHHGSIQEFWKTLRADPSFGDVIVDDLQLSLQLGAFSQNHPPLAKALRARMSHATGERALSAAPVQGTTASLAGTAVSLSKDDWKSVITSEVDGKQVGAPEGTAGGTDEEKAENYAELLKDRSVLAFPTAAVALQLPTIPGWENSNVSAFIISNPEFDLKTMNVSKYLASEAAVVDTSWNAATLEAQLSAVQRIMRIVPETVVDTATAALLAAGFSSALAVTRKSRATFIKSMSASIGGDDVANDTWRAAEFQVARGFAAWAMMHPALKGRIIPALTSSSSEQTTARARDAVVTNPTWEALFGTTDYCTVDEFQSVFSPAAYLTDLLYWLDLRDCFHFFDQRRPDVKNIKLSVENTTVALPYTDLVNEILEARVLKGKRIESLVPVESTATSEELLANPEYIQTKVYDEYLNQALFPQPLPFDLWSELARVYFQHLGVTRHALMETLESNGSPTAAQIASERLQLSPMLWNVLIAADARDVWAHWGFDTSGKEGSALTAFTSSILSQLAIVSEFMDRSGLDYSQLLDLLHTRFANPAGMQITGSACNADERTLSELNAAALGRIDRFLRLWRNRGWTMLELDKTLCALNGSPLASADKLLLNETILLRLADVDRVRELSNATLLDVVSWWTTIDTYADRDDLDEPVPSLYERVFLNRSVHALAADAGFPFALNTDRTELQTTTIGWDATITVSASSGSSDVNIRSALQAALRISAEDLALLIDESLDGDVTTNENRVVTSDVVTLADLSSLYRHVTLARTLSVTLPDLFGLFRLTGINPFDLSQTSATVDFLEAVADIRTSGFSFDDAHYLLEHDADAETRVGITDEAIGLALAELRDGLDKIETELVQAADPSGEITERYLTMILDEAAVTSVMNALMDTAHNPSAALSEQLVPVLTTLNPAAVTAVSMQRTVEDRCSELQKSLVPYLRSLQQEALTIQNIATLIGRDLGSTEDLLAKRVKWTDGAGVSWSALRWLRSADAPYRSAAENESGEIALADDPQSFSTLRLLYKIALALIRMEVDIDEQKWFFDKGVGSGLFDLATLPTTEQTMADGAWAAWTRLVDLFALRDALPGGEPTLVELMQMLEPTATSTPSWEGFRTQLAARTGWVSDDIQALVGTFRFEFPAGWKDGTALRKLVDAFSLIQRMEAPVDQALGWATEDLTAQDAEQIRLVAKAKYDEETWPAIARALRDPVRDKQRAALVGYVIAQDEDIENEEDLYRELLIDVEMNSCMLTSRIKQAISSVQLFIYHGFLNLEAGVNFTREDRDQWEWMQTYRVWEAARKVFLYPENWTEPELRTTKTPFFEQLESKLLQGELTDEAVETAYLDYLQNLAEVSRLEVMGLYHQYEEPDDDGSVDILHVIARTRSTPHTYWYRQWVDEREWTPWEQLDLDIDADHVIVTVHDRRLMVFWPAATQSASTDGDSATYSYNLQLAWSEYFNGEWSGTKLSEGAISVEGDEWSSTESGVYFRLNQGDSLVIECRNGISAHDVVLLGAFAFDSCSGTVTTIDATPSSSTFVIPTNSSVSRMRFRFQGTTFYSNGLPAVDVTGPNQLNVMAATFDSTGELTTTPEEVEVLDTVSGTGTYAYPHQFSEFASQYAFFLDDDKQTFFVMPDRVATDIISKPDTTSAKVFKKDQIDPVSSARLFTGSRWIPPKSNSAQDLSDIPWQPINGATTRVKIGSKDERQYGNAVVTRAFDSSVSNDLNPRALDTTDTFLAESNSSNGSYIEQWTATYYDLTLFQHPYVCEFIKAVRRLGVGGLLDPNPETSGDLVRQNMHSDGGWFKSTYQPTDRVLQPYPAQDIDFEFGTPYSVYNWELFFHVPFLIANRLSQNQQFEEARNWYHYIFDPTNRTNERDELRFWKIAPFHREPDAPILDFLELVASDSTTDEAVAAQEAYDAQLNAWLADPFAPDVIDQLRTTAYQKAIVMKYLNNLLAWGDFLFKQDTIEDINQATQIYVLAFELLGDRPIEVPPLSEPEPTTFAALRSSLSDSVLSDPLVTLENELALATTTSPSVLSSTGTAVWQTFQFGIPENVNLTQYWDTVADRLFKIRNCMNIEGVVRELPLFEPPIDPAMLVRARAAGVDLASALADLNAPLPQYRFSVMMQKAQALNQSVRSLGAALLSALEKQDAEAIANLRASHEVSVLEMMTDVKNAAINEAEASLEAADKAIELTNEKIAYFTQRLNEEWSISGSPEAAEQDQLDALETAKKKLGSAAHAAKPLSSDWSNLQDLSVSVSVGAPGVGGSVSKGVVNTLKDPAAKQLEAQSFQAAGSKQGAIAGESAAIAGFARRKQEWQNQLNLAEKELAQLDKQKEAATVRVALAEKDLAAHEKQVENAKTIQDFMESKYTNEDLYGWMVGQISTLYFQSYQLAYDLAKRAEQAYRHELAIPVTSFIQFGYWDSLKIGLLSGERLQYDLERMDAAYLENNRREYEITKHVSLALLNPDALLRLRTDGTGDFEIPEALFDLDGPGQYLRRIKSVSVTIPCVTGPQTGVPCKLTLLSSRVRYDATSSVDYPEVSPDSRFWYYSGAVESVVISRALDDGGLFVQDHRDERYLPFEWAGAISSWRLQLTSAVPTFDWSSITDVVISLRYTAREGGDALGLKVRTALSVALNQTLARAFSAKYEFPNAWDAFLYPVDGATETTLVADLSVARFPYFAQLSDPKITSLQLVALRKEDATVNVNKVDLTISPAGVTSTLTLTATEDLYGGNPAGATSYDTGTSPGEWIFTMPVNESAAPSDWLDDLVIRATYTVTLPV